MGDTKQSPCRPHPGFEQRHEFFQPFNSLPFFPASPTTVTQMSLSNPTMLRTHSLSNADGQYDPYTDSRFRNSSMSLDEKSRTMSRSGSFRDGFEEGKQGGLPSEVTHCVSGPAYRAHDPGAHLSVFLALSLWGLGLGNSG